MGRCVIENSFGILKLTFRELQHVTKIHVMLMSDVVMICCLLHNLVLDQDLHKAAWLLYILLKEGMIP